MFEYGSNKKDMSHHTEFHLQSSTLNCLLGCNSLDLSNIQNCREVAVRLTLLKLAVCTRDLIERLKEQSSSSNTTVDAYVNHSKNGIRTRCGYHSFREKVVDQKGFPITAEDWEAFVKKFSKIVGQDVWSRLRRPDYMLEDVRGVVIDHTSQHTHDDPKFYRVIRTARRFSYSPDYYHHRCSGMDYAFTRVQSCMNMFEELKTRCKFSKAIIEATVIDMCSILFTKTASNINWERLGENMNFLGGYSSVHLNHNQLKTEIQSDLLCLSRIPRAVKQQIR